MEVGSKLFFVPLASITTLGGQGQIFTGVCRLSDQADHCCYGFFFHLNGFPWNRPFLPERILIHTLIHSPFKARQGFLTQTS